MAEKCIWATGRECNSPAFFPFFKKYNLKAACYKMIIWQNLIDLGRWSTMA
jgi:hypothetical protein